MDSQPVLRHPLDGDNTAVVVGRDGVSMATVDGDVGEPDSLPDDGGAVLRADGAPGAAEVVVAAESPHRHGVGQQEVPHRVLGLA